MKKGSGFAEAEFLALGGRYEKFVSRCAQKGIPLQNLKPIPGGVQGSVPLYGYIQMQQIAKSCQTKLELQKKRGIYFRLRKFRGRWGLVAAPVIFLTAMALFANLVWSIRWQGIEAAQQPLVKQALYSMDIYEGAFLTQQKVRESEKKLLVALPELGWLSLNFSKGRLVVEASEAREKPAIEANDAQDLVSAVDGTVLKTNIEEGVLLKGAGQTVAKGDVLIRAGREDRDGHMIPVHAKGSVIARAKKKYRCVQPLSFEAEVPSESLHSMRTLCSMGRRMPLQKGEELPQDAHIRCQPVTVWGFALPAMIEERFWLPRVQQTVELNEGQAKERARLACLTQLYREFPDAVIEAEEQEISMDKNELCCTLTLTFTADIVKK